MIRAILFAAAMAIVMGVVACGQKGPLKLPDPPKPATPAP
jgi:predicted small lipoprotein YifL